MNQVLERANTTMEQLTSGLRERLGRSRIAAQSAAAPEFDDDDDGNSSLPLFIWGVVTALALWWLYLRPATPERKLNQLRANPRPGPRPGSRPANAAPPQYRAPAAVAEGAPTEAQSEDDLTLIYGIGPARAARLREAGITSFAALAMADAEQLSDLLAGLGSGSADVSTWPEQAALAAKGDWEALEAYKELLRAQRN